MKKLFILLLLLLTKWSGYSQIPVGTWRDHYSFYQSTQVAVATDKIFASAINGVYWYNPTAGTTGKITTVNGLSDVDISAIGYSPYQDLLAVGYENGNIDLVFKNSVVNLPYIMQKPMQGSKQINHFYFDNQGQIFVSTAFGIVVINIEKREIKDTYYIGQGGSELWVNAIVRFNDRIYAATNNGLYSAQWNDPLLIHFASWSIDNQLPSPQANFNALVVYKNKLIINQSTGELNADILWYNDGYSWQQLSVDFNQVRSLWANQTDLVIGSRQGIGIYKSIPGVMQSISSYTGYGSFAPNFVALTAQGRIAVADNQYGLMVQSNQGWTPACPNGPG